jgi:hypothetical protein
VRILIPKVRHLGNCLFTGKSSKPPSFLKFKILVYTGHYFWATFADGAVLITFKVNFAILNQKYGTMHLLVWEEEILSR